MNEETRGIKPHLCRRVGSFTCGVAMVAVGLALAAWLLGWLTGELFWGLCTGLAPLLLVGIGTELCICGTAGDKVQVKYDFGSLVLCTFCVLCTITLAVFAVLTQRELLPLL